MSLIRTAAIAVVATVALMGVTLLAQGDPDSITQALRAHRAGEHERAVELWDLTLTANPDNVAVRTNLVRSLIEVGALDRARDEVNQVLEAEGNRASALNLLGRIERLEDNSESAIAAFERAIAAAPEQAWYHNNLGLTLIENNRPEDAIEALEQAVSLDADQKLFWNNLGVARRVTGDYDGARESFAESLRCDPTFERARQNLDELSPQESQPE